MSGMKSDFQLSHKIFRNSPNWTYLISQWSQRIPEKAPWWNRKLELYRTVYNIKVKGFATDVNLQDTDSHDFYKTMDEPLTGLKLEQYVDELHLQISAGKNAQDWEAIEKAKQDKAAEELRKKMQAEFDRKLAEETARLAREAKEKADADKIEMKMASNDILPDTDIKA